MASRTALWHARVTGTASPAPTKNWAGFPVGWSCQVVICSRIRWDPQRCVEESGVEPPRGRSPSCVRAGTVNKRRAYRCKTEIPHPSQTALRMGHPKRLLAQEQRRYSERTTERRKGEVRQGNFAAHSRDAARPQSGPTKIHNEGSSSEWRTNEERVQRS